MHGIAWKIIIIMHRRQPGRMSHTQDTCPDYVASQQQHNHQRTVTVGGCNQQLQLAILQLPCISCYSWQTFVVTDWSFHGRWGGKGLKGEGGMEMRREGMRYCGHGRLHAEALSHLNLCLFVLASGSFPGISSSTKGVCVRP